MQMGDASNREEEAHKAFKRLVHMLEKANQLIFRRCL